MLSQLVPPKNDCIIYRTEPCRPYLASFFNKILYVTHNGTLCSSRIESTTQTHLPRRHCRLYHKGLHCGFCRPALTELMLILVQQCVAYKKNHTSGFMIVPNSLPTTGMIAIGLSSYSSMYGLPFCILVLFYQPSTYWRNIPDPDTC